MSRRFEELVIGFSISTQLCMRLLAIVTILAMGIIVISREAHATPIKDCAGASVKDPKTWPCITDVDLGFAISVAGKTTPVQWNPRDPTDTSKGRHLWMRSGETVAIYAIIEYSAKNLPPNALFEFSIVDHDEESLIPPKQGKDDLLDGITLNNALLDTKKETQRVEVGSIKVNLTRADKIIGGKTIKQVMANGILVESGDPNADFENENQALADTLEILAPDFNRLLEPQEGIKVVDPFRDMEFTSKSVMFPLTVLLPNENPGAGWLRVDEPPTFALVFLGMAAYAVASLYRARIGKWASRVGFST